MIGTSPQLKKTLRKVFGLQHFGPGREEVIRAAIAGRDTLAIMPDRQRQVAVLSAYGPAPQRNDGRRVSVTHAR
jgi:hypothetical protein